MNHTAVFLLVTTLQLQNGLIAAKANSFKVEYLRRVVEACYAAAPQNPAWGDREQVTLKLLGAYYHESGFNRREVNRNKNRTVDYGLAQVNSIHLSKTFPAWCRANGYAYRPGLIWDLEVNAKFGAYVNELQCRSKHRVYKYSVINERRQHVVWVYLARVPDLVKLLEGSDPGCLTK